MTEKDTNRHQGTPTDTIVWVVGQRKAAGPWELRGIFRDEQKGVAICSDTTHFIGPVKLGEVLPKDTVEWPGAYIPLLRAEDV